MSAQDIGHQVQALSDNGKALMWASYHVMQEVEIHGTILTTVEYVPVSEQGLNGWTAEAEQREIDGGFQIRHGRCDVCFQVRAASGKCSCDD